MWILGYQCLKWAFDIYKKKGAYSMSTHDMLVMSINAKKKRGVLTPEYIEDTKSKMDVFLMNDRITQDEYNELIKMLEVE